MLVWLILSRRGSLLIALRLDRWPRTVIGWALVSIVILLSSRLLHKLGRNDITVIITRSVVHVLVLRSSVSICVLARLIGIKMWLLLDVLLMLLQLIQTIAVIVMIRIVVCEFALRIFIFFAIILINSWRVAIIIFSFLVIIITASFVIDMSRHRLLTKGCSSWLLLTMDWLLQSVCIRGVSLLIRLPVVWMIAHHVVGAVLRISLTLMSSLSEGVCHVLLVWVLVSLINNRWVRLVRHVMASHISFRNSTEAARVELFPRLVWLLGRPSDLVFRVSTNSVLRAFKSRIVFVHDYLIVALVVASVICLIGDSTLLKKLAWS